MVPEPPTPMERYDPLMLGSPSRAARTIAAVILLFVVACGFTTCETPIERERRELRELTESPETVLYRGLKITLRSAPVEPGAAIDPSASEIRRLSAGIFTRLLRPAESSAGVATLAPRDYIALAQEFYELRGELRVTEEDDYPTLLQQFLSASGDPRSANAVLPWYGPDWEHLVLATLWSGSQAAPRPFVVYELSQLEPASIDVVGVRLLARLLRAGTFYQYHWPNLADEALTAYLDDLEGHGDELQAFIEMMAPPAPEPALVHAQWHLPGVLLRGLVRLELEREDEALVDLEAGLADAQTLGLEDEGVWLIGAYVGIRREDPERALANLRKLEASPLLGDDERQLVRDTIAALEDRDPDAALRKITDKLLVARIVGGYLLRTMAKIDWRGELARSSSGRAVLGFTEVMDDEVAAVKGAASVEQLEAFGDQAAASARELAAQGRSRAIDAWHRAVDD